MAKLSVHPHRGYLNTKFSIQSFAKEKKIVYIYPIDNPDCDKSVIRPILLNEETLRTDYVFKVPGRYAIMLLDDESSSIEIEVKDAIKFGGSKHKNSYVFDETPWCFIVMKDRTYFYNRENGEEYVENMRKLISKATILTPNITEAALLLGKDLTEVSLEKTQEFAEELVQKFLIPNVVITGISITKEKIGEVGVTEGKTWSLIQEKLPGSFFGTGDMFASAFLAAFLHGNELEKSCSIAVDFIRLAIMNTKQDILFGPDYAAGLPWLLQEIKK